VIVDVLVPGESAVVEGWRKGVSVFVISWCTCSMFRVQGQIMSKGNFHVSGIPGDERCGSDQGKFLIYRRKLA
jgi:hypothetical protein